ncbi:DDE-type integrase/transposase/recombinase [Flavobacterium psychroterrae]|uniref:DDE-type integrase/transposase/recombinase n=1 Tax=Flavobacterium psychroterrae TaxID=2133767 RepID=A0ABS5PII5_9FLAO|nr:DDE-type integrase/transposase/recombinase [Flavobacterium psychroterrae]
MNIDRSGSNIAAIKFYNKRSFSKIKIRHGKYLNNIVEQGHRFIKWRIQNGLGFKSFESAKRTLSGIEVVHMLRKNQMVRPGLSMFKLFCALAS